MAQFTPYTRPPQDPSYLVSREPDRIAGNTAFGTALSGAGEVFNLAVRGLDEVNKIQIDTELRDRIDRERQGQIEQGQGLLNRTAQAGPNSGNVGGDLRPPATDQSGEVPRTLPGQAAGSVGRVGPPQQGGSLVGTQTVPTGIQNTMTQLNMMAQANRLGHMNDIDYYGKMQEITQNLISRYPGYRGYIEDKATSILGTNSANAQRTAIAQTLRELAGNARTDAEKWRNDVEKFMPWLDEGGARFALSPQVMNNPALQDRIRAFVAGQRASEHRQDQRDKAAQAAIRTNQMTTEGIANDFNFAAGEVMNRAFNGYVFGASGGEFTWQSLYNNVQAHIQGANGNPDPTKLAVFGAQIGQMKLAVSNALDQLALRPQFRGADAAVKIAETKQRYMNMFDGLIAQVGKGHTELATATSTLIAGIKDNATMGALSQPEVQQIAGFIGATGGQFAGQVFQNANVLNSFKNLPKLGQHLSTISTLEIANGRRVTPNFTPQSGQGGVQNVLGSRSTTTGLGGLNVEFNRYVQANDGNVPPPSYMNHQITLVTEMLKQKDNTEAAINAASVIFDRGTSTGFIGQLNPTQQFDAYGRLASPAVAARMKELAKDNPHVWRNYRTWAELTFKQLFNTYIDDVQRNVVYNPRLNVNWSESTQTIQYSDPRRTVRGLPERSTGQGFPPIDRLNIGLGVLGSVLAQDGEKITSQYLKNIGIDFNKKYDNITVDGVMRVLRAITPEGDTRTPQMFRFSGEGRPSNFTGEQQNIVQDAFRSVRERETAPGADLEWDSQAQRALQEQGKRIRTRPNRLPE